MRLAGPLRRAACDAFARAFLVRVGSLLLVVAALACRSDTLVQPPSNGRPEPTSPLLLLTGGTGTPLFQVVPGDPPPSGYAIGLNESGQVSGSVYGVPNAFDAQKAIRWTPGSGFTVLSSCCETGFGADINESGTVVGSLEAGPNAAYRGFVATGSSFTVLTTLPTSVFPAEFNTKALAVNDAGQIVGFSFYGFTNSGIASHAVLWSASGVISDLGTLGGASSEAVDINNAGQVIGTSQIAGGATHAFLWTSGSGMQDLNTLIGAAITSVVEINDAGQIIGAYTAPGGQSHAFRYTPGSGLLDLGTLGGTSSTPTGLNEKGDVVGSSTLSDGSTHAFLWTASDGMEDITAVTAVTEVRRLNDAMQTLTITAPPSGTPSLPRAIPRLVQLSVTQGGNEPPVASFTANCVGQAYPNQCAFDARGSSDDAGIVSYTWDWGNGRTETRSGPTARNTWASAGAYTVTLKVTDAAGLVGYASQQVTVGTLPPNQPPAVQMRSGYPQGGESFMEGVPIDFSAIANDPEDGVIPSPNYSWSSDIDGFLGTGSTLSGALLSVGTHTITVTATDSKGATGTASIGITITPKPTNPPPTASFSWTCAGQTYPHQCAFNAGGSTDDKGIVSYKWDWGNGRTETKSGTTARNTWASAGTYTVTLTVTDTDGATNSTSQQVAVP